MNSQEVKKFVAAMAADPALAAKAVACLEGKKPMEVEQALTEFAKSAGYDFASEERPQEAQSDGHPLTDEALDQVAGGVSSFLPSGLSGTGLSIGQVYDSMGAANKTLEGNIRSFQQTMDPNSQMDLIQLQKLMQDWTIQTQMQSNVIKAMGDALKNTVSNLR